MRVITGHALCKSAILNKIHLNSMIYGAYKKYIHGMRGKFK